MKQPDFLLGSLQSAVEAGANTFMFYTGAPQSTARIPTDRLNITAFHKQLQVLNLEISNVFIHAPYIINLANLNLQKTKFAISFLCDESCRANEIGVQYVIFHPGNALNQQRNLSLKHVSDNLNQIFARTKQTVFCIETMAGKGSEVGINFDEIKFIIDHIHSNYKNRIGICFDTCHLNDAGYDLTCFDDWWAMFDQMIGSQFLKVIHLNDSQNMVGSHKDRHDNIGYGKIGFASLNKICHHRLLRNIPKILETPFYGDASPYKVEVDMLKKGVFVDWRTK